MTIEAKHSVPVFAVLGHPNEGKSSVVSTLTEDDRIRVSPVPGETTKSSEYTVKIDGEPIIRFVDTPGFQVPHQTLAWFQAYKGEPVKILDQFIQTFEGDPFYADECELFRPVSQGSGIIYVVDGSRPVRDDDLAEIEILRLTGRPRMAVINSKANEKDYTADWKHEFQKNFNAIRIFNSNTADFKERIAMLESLKPIDQEWEAVLLKVIDAFQEDWIRRKKIICADIVATLETCISFSLSEPVLSGADIKQLENRMNQKYEKTIKTYEQQMFQNIRGVFKHHLFDHQLPEYSVLSHDLFSRQTWELLGLTTRQLAGAGALAGGSLGAVLDTAAAGITFGVFTAIGSAVGAGSALWGGKKIAEKKRGGLRLGGDRFIVGPVKNIQFFYILLDRAMIYTSHMVNRPHGRRDLGISKQSSESAKRGYTTHFTRNQKKICGRFFKRISSRKFSRDKTAIIAFQDLVESVLDYTANTLPNTPSGR